jgi:hypothetical protein
MSLARCRSAIKRKDSFRVLSLLSFVIAVRHRLLLKLEHIYAGGAIGTARRHARENDQSTVTDLARLRG